MENSSTSLPQHSAASISLGSMEGVDYFAYREFSKVRPHWQILESGVENAPFQTSGWIEAIQEAKRHGKNPTKNKPLFIIGFVERQAVAIYPFEIQSSPVGHYLTWLGEDLSDYNGPIVHANHAELKAFAHLQNLATLIQSKFTSIHAVKLIRNPDLGTQSASFLSEQSDFREAEYKSHATNLELNWVTSYKKLRSAKSRQRLRSKYRALQKLGSVHLRQIRDKNEQHLMVETLLNWKAEQLRSSGRRIPFGTTEHPSILRNTIKQAVTKTGQERLRIFGLFIQGKPIAGMLAFVSDDTFYYFVSAYDPKLSNKYSIGTILLVKTMEIAARSGRTTYDFLIGDEPYKKDWCNQTTTMVNFVKAYSLQGKIICAKFDLIQTLKKKILDSPQLSRIARWVLKNFGSNKKKHPPSKAVAMLKNNTLSRSPACGQ